VSRLVPRRFWIAEIQISEEMEAKIRRRRFVTGDEVREACIQMRTTGPAGRTTLCTAVDSSSRAGRPRAVA
jgi:hypothetical protein